MRADYGAMQLRLVGKAWEVRALLRQMLMGAGDEKLAAWLARRCAPAK